MSFARQGTWMVCCTTLAGIFMFGVHCFPLWHGAASYSAFFLFVSVINLSNLPTLGIQTVFAYETARRGPSADLGEVAGNLVGILVVMTLGWGALSLSLLIGEAWIKTTLKLADLKALWVTMIAVLLYFWLPPLMGVMQGRQRFGILGGTVLANGMGRFLGVGIMLAWFGGNLPTMMVGPIVGVGLAVGLGAWSARDLWGLGVRNIAWRRLLWRALPFSMGPGVVQFMLTADYFVARSTFDIEQSGLYGATGLAGRAGVMFVGPIAGVMFPKLVRESGTRRGADLIAKTAIATTLVVGLGIGLSGMGAYSLPWVLQWIEGAQWIPQTGRELVASRETRLLEIASLVPLFLMAMGPLAVANVFINHLVAGEYFRRIGWIAGWCAFYGLGLVTLPFTMKGLIAWVGFGNGMLLLGAVLLSRHSVGHD